MSQVPNSSFIAKGDRNFLMIDCPQDAYLEAYIAEFKTYNVTNVVCATDGRPYSKESVEQAGIRVHDLPFPDGDAPPPEIVARFLEIVASVYGKNAAKGSGKAPAIAVHCIAGLGRTAVLVAIALIEEGLEPLMAVQMIRAKRRGAINAKQLKYLQGYKKSGKKAGCVVM